MEHATPLPSGGAVFARTDITALKEAEQVLARRSEELSRSNADLAQFASTASHDLQTPLRSMRSYLDLIDSRLAADDPETRVYIQRAGEAAERMQTLIRSLLVFSSVGSGDQVFEPVDVGQLLSEICADFEDEIAEQSATIVLDDMPTIRSDRTALLHVFRNLISNALKYVADGSPQVRVTADQSEDGWTFAIVDNGIGIAPEYHARVFEMFKRLHPDDRYAGTGIGLAICERLVKRLGGKIWVESEVGVGSTFYVTLPV